MNNMNKSVKSIHPWQSVIQTIYNIVKVHGGEIKVETKVDEGNPDRFGKGEGLPDRQVHHFLYYYLSKQKKSVLKKIQTICVQEK